MSEAWHIRVNGGPVQTFDTKATTYVAAAAAVPAIFGVDLDAFPITIEIWVPHLVEVGYGPYFYWIEDVGSAAISVNAFVVAQVLGAEIKHFFQKAHANE